MQTVLIVDDEPRLRKALARSLDQEQFRTLVAVCAEQALELLARRKIDLVITDLVMPGMDGLALTRRIRRSVADTKIIIITAYGTSESKQEAEALGVSAYLAKPFDLSDLKSRVYGLLLAEAPAERSSWRAPVAMRAVGLAVGKAAGAIAGTSRLLVIRLKPRNIVAAMRKTTGEASGVRVGFSGLTSALKRHEVNQR